MCLQCLPSAPVGLLKCSACMQGDYDAYLLAILAVLSIAQICSEGSPVKRWLGDNYWHLNDSLIIYHADLSMSMQTSNNQICPNQKARKFLTLSMWLVCLDISCMPTQWYHGMAHIYVSSPLCDGTTCSEEDTEIFHNQTYSEFSLPTRHPLLMPFSKFPTSASARLPPMLFATYWGPRGPARWKAPHQPVAFYLDHEGNTSRNTMHGVPCMVTVLFLNRKYVRPSRWVLRTCLHHNMQGL